MDKIVRVGAGEDGAVWRRALEGGEWVDGAVVMKEDGGSWVRRARVMGREVVVKCRELGSWWKRVKFGVGMGHGHQQWRGAERLMKAGIATGRPLVVARAVVDGRVCEVMVLEFVAGKTLLELLDEVARGVGPGVREQHAVAREVGKQVGVLDRNRLCNRDHKPSNLVVMVGSGGMPEIAIIDCVGVRPWSHGNKSQATLSALAIEPIGCGVQPRRGLIARALDSYVEKEGCCGSGPRQDTVRFVWSDLARIVRAHGDPRPRVDPLGRR